MSDEIICIIPPDQETDTSEMKKTHKEQSQVLLTKEDDYSSIFDLEAPLDSTQSRSDPKQTGLKV